MLVPWRVVRIHSKIESAVKHSVPFNFCMFAVFFGNNYQCLRFILMSSSATVGVWPPNVHWSVFKHWARVRETRIPDVSPIQMAWGLNVHACPPVVNLICSALNLWTNQKSNASLYMFLYIFCSYFRFCRLRKLAGSRLTGLYRHLKDWRVPGWILLQM